MPRIFRLAVAIALLLIVAVSIYFLRNRDRWTAERLAGQLNEANRLLDRDEFVQAEKLAAEILRRNPESSEALLIAAKSAGGQSNFEQAAGYLKRVRKSDPELWLESRLLLARIYHHRTARLSDAMACYEEVLKQYPDHTESNLGAARLLAVCTRTRDAVPYILRLIRLGAEQKLPLLLIRDASIIQDRALLERAIERDPNDPNPRIGLAWHLLEDKRADEAVAMVQEAVRLAPEMPAAWKALGRALWKTERYAELADWVNDAPRGIDRYADSWLIRAELARQNSDPEGVSRCLLEASRLRPDSRTLHFQLVQHFARQGDDELAGRFEAHMNRLDELRGKANRLFTAGRETNYDELIGLIGLLETMGRYWEAYSWGRVARSMNPSDRRFAERFQTIAAKCETLPLTQTVGEFNVALSVPIDRYDLPVIARTESDNSTPAGSTRREFGFTMTKDAGLEFTYLPGYVDKPRMRMMEFSGGGVGILDFDLDGNPDVYLTQGSADWTSETNPDSDVLYRNRAGTAFTDVSLSAGIREDRFGQGVTCGDFDSDGFPDIYVANIGRNQFWRNNGDGTFTDITSAAGIEGDHWTTSCLLADINGDGHPDIYDVNYVTADDVYERVCTDETGHITQCSPFDFDPERDEVRLSDGSGRFLNVTEDIFDEPPNGKGLGVAAWDADGSGRLTIFVANDTTPNFLFQPVTNRTGEFRLQNLAFPAGVGVNRDGKPEACMGIAVGDVNEDGPLDFHITNFYQESNTLYSPTASPSLFEDRTRDFNLHHPTWNVLGFGTQFLDADLDGALELFVANGHLEESQLPGTPYRMRAQYFFWNGQQFEEIAADSLGPYFQQERIGRAVAKLDWNRDGKEDLLIGQREEPSILLTNTTPDAGRSLCLKLIGVESNRDAFGTTIEIRLGDRTLTHQLVAGSGYQASNERQLIIGCGASDAIDTVAVHWPSGEKQVLGPIAVPAKIVLTEGNTWFPMPD